MRQSPGGTLAAARQRHKIATIGTPLRMGEMKGTMLPAYALSDEALLGQCEISSCSTHGPGGDHRNKTEAAARLRHRPTGIVAQSESLPQRTLNRARALARLRVRLAIHDPAHSDLQVLARHRQERRLHIAVEHHDYPMVVACCLLALVDAQGRLAEAAAALEISSAQLTRLLASDKEVFAEANRIRQATGIGPLHAAS
jgi:ribosome-associated protein